MSGVQQKSSVPFPISQAKGTKLYFAPRYHPVSAHTQMPGGSQNAVTGRNRSMLLLFHTDRSGANFSQPAHGSPFSR